MNSKLVNGARLAYRVIAWLFVAAILIQVYLVGLVLFVGESLWEAHGGFGHMIALFPLLMVILTFVGRMPPPFKGLTGAMFGVYIFQAEVFAGIRASVPQAAAFHPVLALVIFALAVVLALRAGTLSRQPAQAATA